MQTHPNRGTSIRLVSTTGSCACTRLDTAIVGSALVLRKLPLRSESLSEHKGDLTTVLFRTTTLVNFLFPKNRNRMLSVCPGGKRQFFTHGLSDFTNMGIDVIQRTTSVYRFRCSGIVVFLYRTGSAVPSDHQPAGTMNTSIGSGAPLNCGFSMTGDLDRSAPQTAPSMSGV